MLAGLSKIGEYAVDPPLQVIRTIPLFGLIPLFIIWFGIGEEPKVYLIARSSTTAESPPTSPSSCHAHAPPPHRKSPDTRRNCSRCSASHTEPLHIKARKLFQ